MRLRKPFSVGFLTRGEQTRTYIEQLEKHVKIYLIVPKTLDGRIHPLIGL